MTPPSPNPAPAGGEDKLRQKIYKIWGLETAPDGQPNFLLTKEEDGTVIEGADYTDELEQTMQLIAQQNQQAVQKALEKLIKRKHRYPLFAGDEVVGGEYAVTVSDIQAALAAAQPRVYKDRTIL